MLGVLGVSIGGCSIYPLPEDVIPFNSERIAALVRCQTRDAIRQAVVDNIEKAEQPIVYGKQTKDELLAWLRENP